MTTVAHVIDALLDDLCEKRYFTINDCCLYVERTPYVFPLKPTDFIQDILLRYASTHVQFKLSFKRNASPSRFAQRKKLLRTPVPQPPSIPNAYEQLKIQESLIRRQHEIITQLRKANHHSALKSSNSNYENYFDWISRDEDSDDSRFVFKIRNRNEYLKHFLLISRMSSDSIPVCRRQSRQDEYHQAVNRPTTTTNTRSLSRVRFHTEINANESPSSIMQTKSILKKVTAHLPRTSSVDRDIARLTSIKQRRASVYQSDDADDENFSDRSTTDSCLGSLSSEDNDSYIITPHQLETLV